MGWPKCPCGENRLSWLHGCFSQMMWFEGFVTVEGLWPLCLGASLSQRVPRKRWPAQRKVLSSLWAEVFVRKKPNQTSQTIYVLSGLQKYHTAAQILLLYMGYIKQMQHPTISLTCPAMASTGDSVGG